MSRVVNDDVNVDDVWEGQDEHIGGATAHDYSDDDDDEEDEGEDDDDDEGGEIVGNKAEQDRLSKKREAEQQAAEKTEKKKRKFEELKAKKQQKRELDASADEDNGPTCARLSAKEQEKIYNENKPATIDGELGGVLTADSFYDPHQKETKKHPCIFVRAMAAGLPGFVKTLQAPSSENGCPIVIVVCAGARRAADVINSVSMDLKIKVAKLFAKHFKVQEQMDALNRQHFPVAVGTPNRLCKLAEMGALRLSQTRLVLVDMDKDEKNFTVLTLADTKTDFYTFMGKYVQPELEHCKVSLVSVPPSASSKNIKAAKASPKSKGNNKFRSSGSHGYQGQGQKKGKFTSHTPNKKAV